ncbi:MAG: glycosyltransferase [Tepidanaerobacteraceae bacterium]|nr:glycosyltransferase [Tepidanaerobacteraceae bacterium]
MVAATHPNLSRFGNFMVRFLKPDIVFVQSRKSEEFFKNKGCWTALLPSGVDLNRFHPISFDKKTSLRQQYGLPENAFIVLHVGPIKSNRNLKVLKSIQKEMDVQVLIAGSTTVKADIRIANDLEKAGCIVWVRYFPSIEHLFQLSDCYVFPVLSSDGAVQVPLTVLEAAACNLHIVTTPFGGLTEFLSEGNGLYYFNNAHDMINALNICRKNRSVQTRSLTEAFSWEKVTAHILKCYRNLNNEGEIETNSLNKVEK